MVNSLGEMPGVARIFSITTNSFGLWESFEGIVVEDPTLTDTIGPSKLVVKYKDANEEEMKYLKPQ